MWVVNNGSFWAAGPNVAHPLGYKGKQSYNLDIKLNLHLINLQKWVGVGVEEGLTVPFTKNKVHVLEQGTSTYKHWQTGQVSPDPVTTKLGESLCSTLADARRDKLSMLSYSPI